MAFMPKPTAHLSIEEKVQLLMDERDIRALEFRWCRGVDRVDAEMVKSCFHDDAVDHHAPFFEGTAADMLAGFAETMPAFAASTQYNLGNVLVEVEGDSARAECYCWSQKTLNERNQAGDLIMRISGFRYLDRLERRDGEWRIAERWFVPEWGFFQEVPTLTKQLGPFSPAAEMKLKPIAARKDKTDQSYKL